MKNKTVLYISNSERFSQMSSIEDCDIMGFYGVMSLLGRGDVTNDIGISELDGHVSCNGGDELGEYVSTFRLSNIGATAQLLKNPTGATFVGEVG